MLTNINFFQRLSSPLSNSSIFHTHENFYYFCCLDNVIRKSILLSVYLDIMAHELSQLVKFVMLQIQNLCHCSYVFAKIGRPQQVWLFCIAELRCPRHHVLERVRRNLFLEQRRMYYQIRCLQLSELTIHKKIHSRFHISCE